MGPERRLSQANCTRDGSPCNCLGCFRGIATGQHVEFSNWLPSVPCIKAAIWAAVEPGHAGHEGPLGSPICHDDGPAWLRDASSSVSLALSESNPPRFKLSFVPNADRIPRAPISVGGWSSRSCARSLPEILRVPFEDVPVFRRRVKYEFFVGMKKQRAETIASGIAHDA